MTKSWSDAGHTLWTHADLERPRISPVPCEVTQNYQQLKSRRRKKTQMSGMWFPTTCTRALPRTAKRPCHSLVIMNHILDQFSYFTKETTEGEPKRYHADSKNYFPIQWKTRSPDYKFLGHWKALKWTLIGNIYICFQGVIPQSTIFSFTTNNRPLLLLVWG